MEVEPLKDNDVCLDSAWVLLLPKGHTKLNFWFSAPKKSQVVSASGKPATVQGECMYQYECGFVSQGVSQTDRSLC